MTANIKSGRASFIWSLTYADLGKVAAIPIVDNGLAQVAI